MSLEPAMAKKMAGVARSREALWVVMTQVVCAPTREFVQGLRTGAIRHTLEQNTAWVGEDNPMTIHVQSLRAFESRSSRISIEQDMDVLVEDWNQLEGRAFGPELEAWARTTAGLCRAEAKGWENGDVEAAKKVRLAQFDDLSTHLQDAVDRAAVAHAETKVLVRRMLARIYGAHLAIESGRDVLPAIMA